MITEQDILDVGYIKEEDISDSDTNVYYMIVLRPDKPDRTRNFYRLDWDLVLDTFTLVTNLERKTDFDMKTISYMGAFDTKEELENITELFKEFNAKI